ncbi:hypothetical protein UY3_02041 [Chelonia mydas]|uniref:Uncharacterized protein n=1 Tax=Chelonia mydas TaxID=8469 RepID=M7BU24_CHEMY|nr:hypothetical protein UY3_02041 [Chelonia mydas]
MQGWLSARPPERRLRVQEGDGKKHASKSNPAVSESEIKEKFILLPGKKAKEITAGVFNPPVSETDRPILDYYSCDQHHFSCPRLHTALLGEQVMENRCYGEEKTEELGAAPSIQEEFVLEYISLLRVTWVAREGLLLQCRFFPGPYAACLCAAMVPPPLTAQGHGRGSLTGTRTTVALPRNLRKRIAQVLDETFEEITEVDYRDVREHINALFRI